MPIEGFNLENFTANFSGGARSYLFMYEPSFPEGSLSDTRRYLVRSTTLPDSNIEELILNWQGLDFKVAGKQSYSDWTITFNVDQKYNIRNDFELWMNNISNRDKYGKMKDYMQDQNLLLLDYEGNRIGSVKLFNAWPKSVSAITLDYSAMDVAQFDVTFSYQYHEITK